MTVLAAQEIRNLSCGISVNKMILPFFESNKAFGLSYGLGPCGYDIRIDQTFTIYPANLKNFILNALGFKRPSFMLASTIETFNIPNNIAAVVMDKSTWARQGLALQTTIAEPGWFGILTLELSNHGDKPLHIKKGMPIAQMVFHRLTENTELPYVGKYQGQEQNPQPARFSEDSYAEREAKYPGMPYA